MNTNNRNHRRGRVFRYRKQNVVLLGMVLLIAVFVIGGTQLFMKHSVKKHDDGKILQGVCVGSTNVSGMTKKEAVKAVEKKVDSYREQRFSFQLETGDVIKASLKELGLNASNIEKAVNEAAAYGRKGTAARCYKLMHYAKKGKLSYEVPLKLTVDKSKVDRVLRERSKNLMSVPVSAQVTRKDGAVTIIPEKNGETPDVQEAVSKLSKLLNSEWDGKASKLKIAIVPNVPVVTKEDLKDVTDLLGTYTTFYGADGSGRAQNIETAAKHINGIYVKPGETVSANELMEPYTYENGYTEAGSYEKNRVVQTMGGGICQVSTTLYNALLHAELEIVERYPHSMLVGYAEPSMDAAIAENLLDMVFKNNQQTPVYIESILSEGSLTFNIYGKETRAPGREIQFISEVTDTKETSEKQFVAVEQPIGYMEWQSNSQPEITAQLWKVVYENGEEVSRDIVNYSTYMAVPVTYAVGISSDNPEFTKQMENAIASQNEQTIQNTINNIQNAANATQENAAQQ